jgi:hypothetical protein
MKTKDLFAGCFVTIAPDGDAWLVTLRKNNHETIVMRSYGELPDALEAVHEWMLMLGDDTQIRVGEDATMEATELMRDTLARLAIGEEAKMPDQPDEAVLQDELRTWFEREMKRSRDQW